MPDSTQAVADSLSRFLDWKQNIERVAAQQRIDTARDAQRVAESSLEMRRILCRSYRDALARAEQARPWSYVFYALTGAVLGAGATATAFVV